MRDMSDKAPTIVSEILEAIDQWTPKASAELLPLVYSELRKLAKSLKANVPPGSSIQTTGLVHEAYLRLVGNHDPGWDSRGHFFAAAAQAMRRILVEQARRKASLKRGGDLQRIDADDVELSIEPPCEDILALHEALEQLEAEDPRAARVVMYRYFAGLTAEETAAVMRLSRSTIEREWRFARAILFTQLTDLEGGE